MHIEKTTPMYHPCYRVVKPQITRFSATIAPLKICNWQGKPSPPCGHSFSLSLCQKYRIPSHEKSPSLGRAWAVVIRLGLEPRTTCLKGRCSTD